MAFATIRQKEIMPTEPAADLIEDRLKSLCAGNSPEGRREWALGAKSQGRKVIGTLCSYIPEEVIYAAGMLPWRVTGTWDSDVSRALVYRDADMCKYCSHVLEALLRGELSFLDGVVASDWDDDRRRLYDLWCYTDKPPLSAIVSAPRGKSELSQRYFAQELRKLASTLRGAGGVEVTEQSLWKAIEVYDHMRDLIHRVYETRKLSTPPLTGAEMLGITTAAMVMDPMHFNSELGIPVLDLEGREFFDTPAARAEMDRKLETFLDSCIQNKQST